jgi:hypothetical protein
MRPSWKIRRRVVVATIGFCMGCIVYLMVRGEADSRLHETIAMGVIGLFISTVGSYVFGAAWDDKNVMATLGRDAYRDQGPAVPDGYPADIAAPGEPYVPEDRR